MAEEIIATAVPAKNRMGQNGYQGASSTTPGQPAPRIEGFSPKGPQASADPGNWQTRDVGQSAIPVTFGQKDPNANPVKVAGAVNMVTKPAAK